MSAMRTLINHSNHDDDEDRRDAVVAGAPGEPEEICDGFENSARNEYDETHYFLFICSTYLCSAKLGYSLSIVKVGMRRFFNPFLVNEYRFIRFAFAVFGTLNQDSSFSL